MLVSVAYYVFCTVLRFAVATGCAFIEPSIEVRAFHLTLAKTVSEDHTLAFAFERDTFAVTSWFCFAKLVQIGSTFLLVAVRSCFSVAGIYRTACAPFFSFYFAPRVSMMVWTVRQKFGAHHVFLLLTTNDEPFNFGPAIGRSVFVSVLWFPLTRRCRMWYRSVYVNSVYDRSTRINRKFRIIAAGFHWLCYISLVRVSDAYLAQR